MPEVKLGSFGELSFGIDWREIGELIGLLSKAKDDYLNYNTEDIQGFYPSKDLKWLARRDEDIDLIVPCSIEFDYRKHSVGVSWGKVKVVEPFDFPHELASHKESMVEKFERAGKLYKGDRACPRICGFSVSDSGEPEFVVQMARYYDQVGSNLTVDYLLPKSIEVSGEACLTARDWDMSLLKSFG
jgi:hypothetical protein